MRAFLLIATALASIFAAQGCWTMQDIVAGSDGDTDMDGDTDIDGDTDTDSDTDVSISLWGTIEVTHQSLAPGNYGSETLALSAVFFDFDAMADDMPGYLTTYETEGGGHCHIFYFSEWQEHPEPPTEHDVGPIWAGPYDAPDLLSIQFEDQGYTVDYRSDTSAENPLPGWFFDTADFFVWGTGSAADQFDQLAFLPGPSAFTSPVPDDDTVLTDGSGDYIISWEPVDEGEARVRMNFNMDWDWSEFLCYPAPGMSQMIIPNGWVAEYTWGGGADMVLEVVNTYQLQAGEAAVKIESISAYRQNGYFQY